MQSAQTKDYEVMQKQDSQLHLKSAANHEQASMPDVAEIAYYKAENRGFAPGYELNDWLEAEREFNYGVAL